MYTPTLNPAGQGVWQALLQKQALLLTGMQEQALLLAGTQELRRNLTSSLRLVAAAVPATCF